MEKDYKVFIDRTFVEIPSLCEIEKGVYDVVDTDQNYDTAPTVALIKTIHGETEVPVFKYNWNHIIDSETICGQFVGNNFNEKMLDDVDLLSTEEAMENLDGLHHSDYSVEEFVKEYGDGDVHKALKVAIRNDWDAFPTTEQRMNEIMVKVMSKF